MRRQLIDSREGFLDGLGDIFDGGWFAEFADFGSVGGLVEADALGDLTVHFEDGGDLLFGEQEDLEHEVVAFVGTAAHARLAHEDKGGEDDRFEGDEGAEKGKGGGVEVGVAREGVEEQPGDEEGDVGGDEAEAANERRDGVAEAFAGCALSEEVLLVFGNEVDMVLEVGRGHG